MVFSSIKVKHNCPLSDKIVEALVYKWGRTLDQQNNPFSLGGIVMRIGIPKEIKNNENRVAMTPAGVFNLKAAGHEVIIETGAGLGSSFTDEEYTDAGAKIVTFRIRGMECGNDYESKRAD